MPKTSYFLNAKSTEPIMAVAEELFEEIKTGVFRTQIDRITQLKQEGKDYQEEKKRLPGFTPSVICKGGRSKETIVGYTGVIVTDIDHIGDQLDIVRSMAYGLPYVWKAFVSPSGCGLKILTKTDADLDTHEEAVKQLSAYYSKELDVKIDDGKDPVRLCFMSFDPELFSNENAEVFKIRKVEKKDETSNPLTQMNQSVLNAEVKDKFKECIQWTNKYKTYVEGNRNNYVYYLANNCNRKGINKEVALEFIMKNYGYDIEEVKNSVESAYKNLQEHSKYADAPSLPEPIIYKINYTDIELANMEVSNRFLVEELLQSSGTSILCGLPDSAKSQFARQLCLHLCCGKDDFLGRKLFPKHQKALIVATEDNEENISFLIKKQLEKLEVQAIGNLKFLFAASLSQNEILIEIESHLTQHPSDLIIIDCLGDIFDGNDMNNNVSMRKTVAAFDYLAQKHKCHVMFIHHITKSSYKSAPSQQNILGGSGLTQKVRLALQLSNGEGNEKYLSVVKGNYLKREQKQLSKVLIFDEDSFLFSDSGMVEATDALGSNEKRDTKRERLQRLRDDIFEGKSLSYTEFINKNMESEGIGKAQAQRNHKNLKEMNLILKDGKKWKPNDSIASAS